MTKKKEKYLIVMITKDENVRKKCEYHFFCIIFANEMNQYG